MGYVASILYSLEPGRQVPAVEALADVLPPEWVRDAVERCGRSSQRRRLLPAELTVWIVVLLGLFRRHSYANLLALLVEARWSSASWSSEPSTRALVKARDRLGAEPLQVLFERSAAAWSAALVPRRVGDFAVCAIDGASFLVPDSPENREHFGAPASTRGRTGYPQMRVVALVDVGSRLVRAFQSGPFRESEMALARRLLASVPEHAFVILDRLYYCHELLHRLRTERGAHFLVRLKRNVVTRRIKSLGRGDHLVEVRLAPDLRRLHPELPDTWTLREVTYKPAGSKEPIRVLTSWLDPLTLPFQAVAGLYHERWESETSTDEIKTHQCESAVVSRPTTLRSLSPERIRQEFLGLLLAYNATRVLLARAAAASHLPPARLSFTGALHRLREAVRDMMQAPATRLIERYARLLAAVARAVVPLRPGRQFPRAVKVKMSKYPVKGAA